MRGRVRARENLIGRVIYRLLSAYTEMALAGVVPSSDRSLSLSGCCVGEELGPGCGEDPDGCGAGSGLVSDVCTGFCKGYRDTKV